MSWRGRRFDVPTNPNGLSGSGVVLTERQGIGDWFTLGIQLDGGGFVFAVVRGAPPEHTADLKISADMIGPPALTGRELRDLATAVLNGRAARGSIENVERALAAGVLTFVSDADPAPAAPAAAKAVA